MHTNTLSGPLTKRQHVLPILDAFSEPAIRVESPGGGEYGLVGVDEESGCAERCSGGKGVGFLRGGVGVGEGFGWGDAGIAAGEAEGEAVCFEGDGVKVWELV